AEEPSGRGEGIQGERTVTGTPERRPRPFRERLHVPADRSDVFERREVMMRNRLGVILGPAERLEPLRGPQMLLAAPRAWNLSVRDVAHQRVVEDVLALSAGGRPILAEEPAPVEGAEGAVHLIAIDGPDRGDPLRPERPADRRR